MGLSSVTLGHGVGGGRLSRSREQEQKPGGVKGRCPLGWILKSVEVNLAKKRTAILERIVAQETTRCSILLGWNTWELWGDHILHPSRGSTSHHFHHIILIRTIPQAGSHQGSRRILLHLLKEFQRISHTLLNHHTVTLGDLFKDLCALVSPPVRQK